ncbi:hypothetical protein AAVH_34700, partial [Aphelenchoides avenae]
YIFNALAYLPYNRDDQQCRSKDNIVDVGYKYLNFFVLAKSDEDLCQRLSAALEDNDVNINAFGGVAAVKCGYEFVWYELGYTYFYAVYSSTDYKWEKKGGAYDVKCGQIFFFP